MWLLITVARSVTSKRLVAPIDGVLKEHGFVRKKMTLNRRSESLVDVVDLQVSKAGDAVTLNAGVVDREARRLLWGPETDQFLQVPECTVRSRPGELIDGRDVWWALDDEEAAEKIARTRVHRVLPFLERMHDPLAMEAQLAPHGAKHYPPPIIYLAILKQRRGETAEAESLLRVLHDRTTGPWRERVGTVFASLGSQS